MAGQAKLAPDTDNSLIIMWLQKEIHLKPRARGFHLITDELLRELPELRDFRIGMMSMFIMHTSASLTINENADPTVREDFESWFNHAVREGEPWYLHRDEGADDLPAHIKSSLRAAALTSPSGTAASRWGRGRASTSASTGITAAAAVSW